MWSDILYRYLLLWSAFYSYLTDIYVTCVLIVNMDRVSCLISTPVHPPTPLHPRLWLYTILFINLLTWASSSGCYLWPVEFHIQQSCLLFPIFSVTPLHLNQNSKSCNHMNKDLLYAMSCDVYDLQQASQCEYNIGKNYFSRQVDSFLASKRTDEKTVWIRINTNGTYLSRWAIAVVKIFSYNTLTTTQICFYWVEFIYEKPF